jgi:hypothetical protein
MKQFDVIRATRNKVLEITAGLSLEEVNRIPAGMNNNIVWNLAHVIATQRNLFYVNPGLIPTNTFIESYKVGTKPEKFVDQATYDSLRAELLSDIDKLEEDYSHHAFVNFKEFASKTYAGLVIRDVDSLITFLAMHEGLHLGYIMAMKRHLITP